ncbi:Macrolide export ATP-binding/permease protein MacB [Limihaloglobus sulfuriphilus]|uniref:Macrolide export ATP-binding/permease protein MacB n=1 Tax=Limihaloglobus sulfuriphilus TaxID=1851148 RepID=A0A1Q2MES1_9BACT|nr:ABC transporter permease [Limihaloglobus sulfuriphilus]AQQ71206.1 Macrolide export ATP-binding/permease protein MacB [Limihaloglobus sulfuriphilus]
MKQSKLVKYISSGVENLLLHKLRSMLTMLGVVFGVGSVVAMLAVGEGASKDALEQINKLGSRNIIVNSVKPLSDEGQKSSTTSFLSMYGLKYDDYQRITASYENVKKTAPAKIFRKETRLGSRLMELRVVGTSADWFELIPRQLMAGRVIFDYDVESSAPVAVLTEYGARKLLATKETIGQVIRIGSDSFRVIGIIKSESGTAGNMQIPDQEIDVYIPFNVAKQYYGDIDRKFSSGSLEMEMVELHQIIVEVNNTENVEKTAAAIMTMLERFHKKTDYKVNVPLALLKQAEATKRTFNIVLGSIAGISLLVGGIGIMNIMLASVTERTREIGIRRAIGAQKRQIVIQFLVETVVLSIIGGIIGIGVGIGIPLIITTIAGMPTVITLWSVLLPLVISGATGIIFGLYPAVIAAGVDPIIALRHE